MSLNETADYKRGWHIEEGRLVDSAATSLSRWSTRHCQSSSTLRNRRWRVRILPSTHNSPFDRPGNPSHSSTLSSSSTPSNGCPRYVLKEPFIGENYGAGNIWAPGSRCRCFRRGFPPLSRFHFGLMVHMPRDDYVAVLDDGGRVSKYEVNGAVDLAFTVELSQGVHE